MTGTEWIQKLISNLPSKDKLVRIEGAAHEVLIGLMASSWLELDPANSVKNSPATCKFSPQPGMDKRKGMKQGDLGLLFTGQHVGLLEVENNQRDWIKTAHNLLTHAPNGPEKCREASHQGLVFGVLAIWKMDTHSHGKQELAELHNHMSKHARPALPTLILVFERTGWNGQNGSERFSGKAETIVWPA